MPGLALIAARCGKSNPNPGTPKVRSAGDELPKDINSELTNPLGGIWIALVCWTEEVAVEPWPAGFAICRAAGLACRTGPCGAEEPAAIVGAVPLRTCAPAVEQIRTPASAAPKRWILAVMRIS